MVTHAGDVSLDSNADHLREHAGLAQRIFRHPRPALSALGAAGGAGTGGDGRGRAGTGRDGTGRDGTGWDGMGREGMGLPTGVQNTAQVRQPESALTEIAAAALRGLQRCALAALGGTARGSHGGRGHRACRYRTSCSTSEPWASATALQSSTASRSERTFPRVPLPTLGYPQAVHAARGVL